jgi:hypothetical protein
MSQRHVVLAAVSFAVWSGAAFADEFYVSMRSMQEDAAPAMLPVSLGEAEGFTSAIATCRGKTVYARASDATVINAARAAGDTVQIHRAAEGAGPEGAAVICLVQADQ